ETCHTEETGSETLGLDSRRASPGFQAAAALASLIRTDTGFGCGSSNPVTGLENQLPWSSMKRGCSRREQTTDCQVSRKSQQWRTFLGSWEPPVVLRGLRN